MATFKEFSAEDIKTSRSFLNQLVDIVNTDISGATTRRKYQVFVTGGVGPGVTSSLFQTVYDQDFTVQTANPVFDVTFGLRTNSEVVTNKNPATDANGKLLFPADSLMMREKIDIYRLFAQNLLGDPDGTFTARSGTSDFEIREALFLNFRRLFSRDQIKRETFAIRYRPSGSTGGELDVTGSATTKILTDINSSTNKDFSFGGQVSTVVDSANTSIPLGLLFIDQGVLVLDISRSFDVSSSLNGEFSAVTPSGTASFDGNLFNLLSSGSVDTVIDHICSTRFAGSEATSITYQNITNINSTLFFARASADEFNYSANPTFIDANNRIVVIDEGQEEVQRSFTFISSVGLYDAFDNLLGVAKMSRPVLKDGERDLTFKVRLDF